MTSISMKDRVVLVTGAGKGIGRGIALAMAEAGADVVVAARTLADVEDTAEAARKHGVRALAVQCDVTERASLERLAKVAVEELGRVDVLVNNAGGAPHVPFLKTSEAVFEHALRFNVTQAFLLTRLLVPQMLERGNGCVLNVSSSLGRVVGRGFVAYGTAKAALEHMTRLMAAELAPKIRVNAVSCGAIETEALGKFLSNDAVKQGLVKKTPLRTVGTVEDVANAALYLCSDMSRYVTGRILPVDGGIDTSNTPFDLPDL
ncbi:MAG: glucose 1-dehydrogenase [Myxococcales bacterium]|nr:glucose 1-dehydrogenase [Myxococcales bacterium]